MKQCFNFPAVLEINSNVGGGHSMVSRGRMGERGQGARREHSREVVRQRMLHLERGGMSCGTRPHDWKARELESIKNCLSKTNE
jgi:hypothetical protein